MIYFVASHAFTHDPRSEKSISALKSNGYKIKKIGWNREAEKINEEGIFIEIKAKHGAGKKNILKIIFFQLILFLKLVKERRKISFIHSINFDTGLTVMIFSKVFKKKYVYDMYDFYVDSFPVPLFLKGLVKKLEWIVINNSHVTLLPIESRKEQIKGSNPREIKIIHNSPVDTYDETKKNKSNDNIDNNLASNKSVKIGFVGVFQKGRYLQEIVEIVSKDAIFELHIGGYGDPNIEHYIKDASSKYSNIYFYGKVNYDESLKISQKSDVLLCVYDPTIPNHQYSAPNKFYEAMMLSKPIIVCENMGIDKEVNENNTGYVINYNDVGFSNELRLKMLDKLDRLEKGKNSRKLYETKYSWENSKKELLQCYQELYKYKKRYTENDY